MHQYLNTKTGKISGFPSDIDELNPDQYIKYLELVMSSELGIIDIPEMKKRLIRIVCPIRFGFRYIFKSKQSKQIIWTTIVGMSDNMDSFFDIEETPDKLLYHPHTKSGRNLLPCYKGYKGPDDMLNNITWGDFINCMNLINIYQKQTEAGNTENINNTISEIFNILYKPGKWSGRKTVPHYIKFHAVNLFTYIFELISTQPIPINGEEIDFRILFSGKNNNRKDDKTGWAGLVYSIAESGVFGRTSDINKEKFWDVLIYLYKCTFENLNRK